MKREKKGIMRLLGFVLAFIISFSQPLEILAANGIHAESVSTILEGFHFAKNTKEEEEALGIQADETEEAATLNAQMKNIAQKNVKEYGFIWSTEKENPNPDLHKNSGIKKMESSLEGDTFAWEQDYPSEEVYFVRAYVKLTGILGKTIYSPSIAVKRENSFWRASYSEFDYYEGLKEKEAGELVRLESGSFTSEGWQKFFAEGEISENVVVNGFGYVVSHGLTEPTVLHYDEIVQNHKNGNDGYDCFRFNMDLSKILNAKVRPFVVYNNQFVTYGDTISVKGERKYTVQAETPAYESLEDGVQYYGENYENIAAKTGADTELLKELMWPETEAEGKVKDGMFIMSGAIVEDYGHTINEFGFVWSRTGQNPTVSENDGIKRFASEKDASFFEMSQKTEKEITARAYVIYNNQYVAYSNQITNRAAVMAGTVGNEVQIATELFTEKQEDENPEPEVVPQEPSVQSELMQPDEAVPASVEKVYDMTKRTETKSGSTVNVVNTEDDYKWVVKLSTDKQLPTNTRTLAISPENYESLKAGDALYLVMRADVLGEATLKFNGFSLGAIKNSEEGYEYYVYQVYDYMLRNGTNVLEFYTAPFVAVSSGDIQFVTNHGPMTENTGMTPFVTNDVQYKTDGTGAKAVLGAEVTIQNNLKNNLRLTTVNMAKTLNEGTYEVGGGESFLLEQTGSFNQHLTFTLPMNVENAVGYQSYQILTTEESNEVLAIRQTNLYANSNGELSDFTVQYEPENDSYVDTMVTPVKVHGYLFPLNPNVTNPLSEQEGIEEEETEQGVLPHFVLTATEKGYVSQNFAQEGKESFAAYYHVGNIDTTAPVLALRGESAVTMLEGHLYQEQGFELIHQDWPTVDNDEAAYSSLGYTVSVVCYRKEADGSLTEVPDYLTAPMAAGNYEIHYNATDITGHQANGQIRYVAVKEDDISLLTVSFMQKEDGVTLNGKIEQAGSYPIAERGFLVREIEGTEDGVDQTVTVLNYDMKCTVDPSLTDAEFSYKLAWDKLTKGQTYAYAAYARSEEGRIQIAEPKTFVCDKKTGHLTVSEVKWKKSQSCWEVTIALEDSEYPVRVWYQTVDGSTVAGNHYEATSDTVDLDPGKKKTVSINSPVSETYQGTKHREFFFEVYQAKAYKNEKYSEENVVEELNVAGLDRVGSIDWLESNYSDKAFKDEGMTYQTSTMVGVDKGHLVDDNELEGSSWDRNPVFNEDISEAKRYLNNGNTMWFQYGFNYTDNSSGAATGSYMAARVWRKDNNALIIDFKKDLNDAGNYVSNKISVGTCTRFEAKHDAGGNANNQWYLKDAKFHWGIYDSTPPEIKKVTLSNTRRVPGQKVFASIQFDEPVKVEGTPAIEVKVGANGTLLMLNYTGGSKTDVLYFTGTVAETSTRGVPVLNKDQLQGTVKDFAGNKIENAKLEWNKYAETITVQKPEESKNTPANAWTVNVHVGAEDDQKPFEYVWNTHENATADTTGWQAGVEGVSVTTPEGVTGTYYLHVRAADAVVSSGPYMLDNEVPGVELNHPATSEDADDDYWDGNNGEYTNKIVFKAKTIDQNVSTEEEKHHYAVTTEETRPEDGDERWTAYKDNTEVKVPKEQTSKTGVYYVHFKVTDKAGNTGYKTSKPYYIDADAPKMTEEQILISDLSEKGFRIDIKNAKDAGEEVEEVVSMLPSGINSVSIEYQWEKEKSKEANMEKYVSTSMEGTTVKDFRFNVNHDTKLGEKGTYHLTFKITDMAGNVQILKKEVEISAVKPELVITRLTGTDGKYRTTPVVFEAQTRTAENGQEVKALTLPDGTVIKDNAKEDKDEAKGSIRAQYKAKKNGTYIFIAVDKNGTTAKKEEKVTNIDKKAPIIKAEEAEGILTIKIEDELPIIYHMNEDGYYRAYTESVKIDVTEKRFVVITAQDAAGNESVYTYKKPYKPDGTGTDKEAPKMELIGPETVYVTTGSSYLEYGVYVTDNQDKNPKITIDDKDLKVKEPGTYTISYTAKDKSGNTSKLTRTVIVEDGGNINVVFDEITVSDGSGFSVSAEQITSALHVNSLTDIVQKGEVSKHGCMRAEVQKDGDNVTSVLLIPNPYFNGKDSITFTAVTDTKGDVEVKLTASVKNVENAPIAADDKYDNIMEGDFVVKDRTDEKEEYEAAHLPVLHNDWDPDMPKNNEPYESSDEILITEILANGQKGTAKISKDGKALLYTPNLNQRGEDTITYQISDRLGQKTTAKATIYIHDTVAPKCSEVSAVLQGTDNAFDLNGKAFTNQTLTVRLRLTDYYEDGTSPGSGVASLELVTKSKKQSVYQAMDIVPGVDTQYIFDVPANQEYLYRIQDTDGNVTEKEIIVDKIDKEAPQLEAVWDGTTSLTGADINLTFSEKGVSGYDTFTIQRDHAAAEDLWAMDMVSKEDGTGIYHVSNNGNYTVILKDKAGNVVTKEVEVQAVDNAPPTVSYRITPAGLTYGDPADIQIMAKDSISKIAKIRYPDGTEEAIEEEDQKQEAVFHYEVKENGRYLFTVWDSLGLSTSTAVNVTNIASENIHPEGLTVNKEQVALYINGKKEEKISAYVTPEHATNRMVNYTSSNPEVVAVEEDGTILALQETGDTLVIVTASLDGAPEIKKEISVTVSNVVESIGFATNEYQVERNKTLDFDAYANGYSLVMKEAAENDGTLPASDKRLMYASSDEKICTVDENGVVTGHYPGRAIVSVLSDNGVMSACVVNVVIPVETIGFQDAVYNAETNEWEMLVSVGTEKTAAAEAYPETATNRQLVYTSDNPEVIAVTNDSTGSIKVLKEGMAVITATSKSDASVQAKLRIIAAPKDTGVNLDKNDEKLYIGEEMQLNALVEPSDSQHLDRSVKYTSDNLNIASVDENGKVRANYEGTATITATTASGNTSQCKVTVMKVVEKIEAASDKLEMFTGQIRAVAAYVTPEESQKENVNWYAKDQDETNPVVLVDAQTGAVTALRSGTATVVAEAKKTAYTPEEKVVPSAQYQVVVTSPVSKINLYYYDPEDLTATEVPDTERKPFEKDGETETVTIPEGKSMQLIAEPNADADDKTITWKSSHPGILRVDAKTGRVQALKGDNNTTVTITATAANLLSKSVNMKVGESVGEFKLNTISKWVTADSQKEYKKLAKFTLEAVFDDSYEGNRTVNFESLNPEIATVKESKNGEAVVTGKKEGVAYIRVWPEADETMAVECRVLVDRIMTEEDVPEKALLKALTDQIDKDGATEGTGDGYLRRTEMQEYTGKVDASNLKISDIQGMEELKLAESIDLSGNPKLKKIKSLEKLSELQKLNVSHTAVKEYTFLKDKETIRYPKLTTLQMAGNNLSDESILKTVAEYSGLKELDISENRFKELQPIGALGLNKLSVQYNELTSPLRTQTILDTMKAQNAAFKGIVSYQGPKDGDKLKHDAMVWCGVGGYVTKVLDGKYYNLTKNVKYHYFDKGEHQFETYLSSDTETTKIAVSVDCESRELKLYKENTAAGNANVGEYKFMPAAGVMITVGDREYISNASGVVRIGYEKGFDGTLEINYSDNLAVDITGDTEDEGRQELGTPGQEYIIDRSLEELPDNDKIYLYRSVPFTAAKADRPILTMLLMNKNGISQTSYDLMTEKVELEKALEEKYVLTPYVDWIGEKPGKIEFGMFNIKEGDKFIEAKNPYEQNNAFRVVMTLEDGKSTDNVSITDMIRKEIINDNNTSVYIRLTEDGKIFYYKLPIELFQYIRQKGEVAGNEAKSGSQTEAAFGFEDGFDVGFGYGPVNVSFVYDGQEFCVSAGFEIELGKDDKPAASPQNQTNANNGTPGQTNNTPGSPSTPAQQASDTATDLTDWQKIVNAVKKDNLTQKRFNRMKQALQSPNPVGGFLKEGFKPEPNQAISDFMDSGISIEFGVEMYGLILNTVDGKKVSYCTSGTISAGVGVSWEFTYPVTIVFVPAYTKLEASASLGVAVNVAGPVNIGHMVEDAGAMEDEYNTGWDDSTMTISAGVGVGLILAVGVDGLASAGIKGEVGVELSGIFGKEENLGCEFEFTTGASVFLAFLFFEVSSTFATYEYKTDFKKAAAPENSARILTNQVQGVGVTSRSYALAPSVFYEDVEAVKGKAAEEEREQRGNVNLSLIEANTYPYAEPVYTDLGDGRQMLVWVDDNRERDSMNKTALYYSICEDGVWSNKQMIADDGTADFAPIVKVNNGKVYVAWQNSRQVYEDKEVKNYSEGLQERLLSSVSIQTAVYDLKKDDGFVPIKGEFDTLENYHANVAMATGKDGQLAVVWSVNDRNSTMGTEGRNVLYYSELKDGVFGEPVEIASTMSVITYADVAYDKGKLVVVYNEDRDNNLQSTADKELYLFEKGSGVKQLTNDVAADINPNLIREEDGLKLYWIKDDKICVAGNIRDLSSYTSIMNDDETIAADRLQFVQGHGSKAIFWEQLSGETETDVYGMFYDAKSGKWSSKAKVTDEKKRLSAPTGYFDKNGELKSVVIVRDVEDLDYIENETKGMLATETLGKANLSKMTMRPAYDVAINNVKYDKMSVSAGNKVEFSADVTNYGQKAVSDVTIEMFHKGRKVGEQTVKPLKEHEEPVLVDGQPFVNTTYEETILQPGQTLPIKFEYTMPKEYDEYTLNLSVSAGDGSDLDGRDNTYEITFEGTNLSVYIDEIHEKSTKRAIEYRVLNTGGKTVKDIDVALQYKDTKEVIKSLTLDKLVAGNTYTSEIEVDIDELDFAGQDVREIELVVSNNAAETTKTDNTVVSVMAAPDKDEFIVRNLFEFKEKNLSVKLGETKKAELHTAEEVAQMAIQEAESPNLQLSVEKSNCIYKSSNPKAVTVDKSGIVKAVGPGTAEITAYDVVKDMTATCKVSVVVPVNGVKTTMDEVRVAVGLSEPIGSVVAPEEATDKTVEWISSDEEVAVVSAEKVYGVAPGVATLTAKTKDGEFTDTVTVYVSGRVEGVALTETQITLTEGENSKLHANVLPVDAANQEIYWVTANDNIVYVDADGTITAKRPGSTVVTASTAEGNFWKDCVVTVVAKETNDEGGSNTGGSDTDGSNAGVHVTPGIDKDTTPSPQIIVQDEEKEAEHVTTENPEQETTEKKPPVIDVTEQTVITKEQILEALKEKDTIFVYYDKDGNVLYSWKFDPTRLKGEIPEEIDLDIVFDSKYRDKLIKYAGGYEGFFISTKYRGELPAEAEITVLLDKKWRKEHPGKNLYVYYYDEKKDELVLLESGLKEENGYVSFHTTHGGDFMITDKLLDSETVNEKLGVDRAFKIIGGIALAMFVIAAVVLVWRRRKNK